MTAKHLFILLIKALSDKAKLRVEVERERYISLHRIEWVTRVQLTAKLNSTLHMLHSRDNKQWERERKEKYRWKIEDNNWVWTHFINGNRLGIFLSQLRLTDNNVCLLPSMAPISMSFVQHEIGTGGILWDRFFLCHVHTVWKQ